MTYTSRRGDPSEGPGPASEETSEDKGQRMTEADEGAATTESPRLPVGPRIADLREATGAENVEGVRR